jgi:hypothetical protein
MLPAACLTSLLCFLCGLPAPLGDLLLSHSFHPVLQQEQQYGVSARSNVGHRDFVLLWSMESQAPCSVPYI